VESAKHELKAIDLFFILNGFFSLFSPFSALCLPFNLVQELLPGVVDGPGRHNLQKNVETVNI
jgi:hypothetical protein